MDQKDNNQGIYPYPPPQYTPSDQQNFQTTTLYPIHTVSTAKPTTYPPPPLFAEPPIMAQPQVQTIIVQTTSIGSASTSITCPSCRQIIHTKVDTQTGTKAHLFALMLCIVGCWPCCLLPYCMDSCHNVNHSCPSCGAHIGTYTSG